MPAPDTSLLRRVTHLERELQTMQRLIAALTLPTQASPLQLRLAQTVADTADTPNYPASPGGRKFKIVFVDDHFTKSAGTETGNATTREDSNVDFQTVAKSVVGYIEEGEIVAVARIRGIGASDKGDWWIISPGEP